MLSTMAPIHKPANLVKSYWPIVLTSVCCKLFERILLRRFFAWGGQQRILPPNHFVFLPIRDCTLALSTFLHDIRTGLELRNSFRQLSALIYKLRMTPRVKKKKSAKNLYKMFRANCRYFGQNKHFPSKYLSSNLE